MAGRSGATALVLSFSPSKIKIQFFKKQLINKSASVILGPVRLIVLSCNRENKHINKCKVIGHPHLIYLCASQCIVLGKKLSNKQSSSVIIRPVRVVDNIIIKLIVKGHKKW